MCRSLFLVSLGLFATTAWGHPGGAPNTAPMASMPPAAIETMSMPATAANPFGPAEMDMHGKMMAATGADATETYVRKMVEHHRGAIAMARLELQQNPDAKARKLATKAIAEQTRGIGELNAWLRAHNKPPQ